MNRRDGFQFFRFQPRVALSSILTTNKRLIQLTGLKMFRFRTGRKRGRYAESMFTAAREVDMLRGFSWVLPRSL